jgi:hypothetical protein
LIFREKLNTEDPARMPGQFSMKEEEYSGQLGVFTVVLAPHPVSTAGPGPASPDHTIEMTQG